MMQSQNKLPIYSIRQTEIMQSPPSLTVNRKCINNTNSLLPVKIQKMRGNKLSVENLELLVADDRIQFAEAERKSRRPHASCKL